MTTTSYEVRHTATPTVSHLGLTAGVVDLTDNEIAEIPDTICTANITKLILNNNRFVKLFAPLTKVRIRNIADEIGQCHTMQELWLENNKLFLMPMPKTLGNMKGLHTLVLRGNQLEEIPDEIANCPYASSNYLPSHLTGTSRM